MIKNWKPKPFLKSNWQKATVVFALGIVWIALNALNIPYPVTKGSSQLSSHATTPRWSATEVAKNTVKFYDLQLELRRDHRIQLENGKTVVLPKKSKISLSVSDRTLGYETDPKKVDLGRVLESIRSAARGRGIETNGVNKFSVIESSDRNLIGEASQLNLANLVRNKSVSLHNIEEEVLETGLNDVEGSVCVDCDSNDSRDISILEIFRRLTDPSYKANEPSSYIPIGATGIDAQVQAYVTSDEVKALMATIDNGYRVTHRRRSITVKDGVRSSSRGICYRGVKTVLQRSGMVDRYLPGGSARGAGPHLQQDGFINLLETDYKEKITSPNDAPLGSVLVYEGDPRTRSRSDRNYRHGHIEIRTDQGFISDYFSETARTGDALAGRGRRLVGVYIKSNNNIGQLAMDESNTGDK